MKKFIKITLGLMLAGAVPIGGCAALVGAGAHSVDKQLQRDHDKTAISKRQLASVHMGDNKRHVLVSLGKPEDSQHDEFDGGQGIGKSTNDCVYYNVKGENWTSGLASYQLCFTNGKLDSKSQY